MNKPESPRDSTTFILSSIFSFEIISAVAPEPKIFLDFDDFMLINKSFKAKSLYRFGTSLSLHDSLQRDPVSFIIPHLNLLAGEFDNLLLILLY